ncbi:MAG: tetratricopeptide repeat protein [Rickettsiales bacterium]|nr:tetratricopeptide repeat protein [Rickettsiales bacterium]
MMHQISTPQQPTVPTIQQAMQLQGQGRFDEAEQIYSHYLTQTPEHPDVNYLMGAVLMQKEQLDNALPYLESAHQTNPSHVEYTNLLASALSSRQEVDRALTILAEAFNSNPNATKLFNHYIQIAQKNERFDKMEAFLLAHKARIEHGPEYARFMGMAAFGQHKYMEACEHFHNVLTKHKLLNNFSIVSYGQSVILSRSPEKYEEFIAFCEAFDTNSEHYERLLEQRAFVEAAVGHYEEAIKQTQRSIEHFKPSLESLFILGTYELRESNLTDGFDHFRLGQVLPDTMRAQIFVPCPRWRGESLKDKKLMIHTEQGVGDIAMWSSLISGALDEGAEITFSAYPKMKALMQRSFPNIKVVTHSDTLSKELFDEDFDYYTPIGNLTDYRLEQYKPATCPHHLKADAEKAAHYRQTYLEQSGGAKKLIGISWATKRVGNGFVRNIPLEWFKPLLALDEDVQFVSLQYDWREDELKRVNTQLKRPIIFDKSVQSFDDTDDWAAQIAAMDEIITVQNAAAHMGGSLGIPTTLLLSSFGCWRWGTEEKNKWYASVDVFRQAPFETWQSVISRLIDQRKPR